MSGISLIQEGSINPGTQLVYKDGVWTANGEDIATEEHPLGNYLINVYTSNPSVVQRTVSKRARIDELAQAALGQAGPGSYMLSTVVVGTAAKVMPPIAYYPVNPLGTTPAYQATTAVKSGV